MTIALLPKNTNSDWPSLYITDDRGTLLANLANALTALRTDPGLSHALAYDEMLRMPMLLHPIGLPLTEMAPRPLIDKDIADIQDHLQRAGLKRIGRQRTSLHEIGEGGGDWGW